MSVSRGLLSMSVGYFFFLQYLKLFCHSFITLNEQCSIKPTELINSTESLKVSTHFYSFYKRGALLWVCAPVDPCLKKFLTPPLNTRCAEAVKAKTETLTNSMRTN